MPNNPNAALISGLRKSCGKHLTSAMISFIYKQYKNEYYPKLLQDSTGLVSNENKNAIAELLKKPWNPYIRRHSALTEKSKFLKESMLKSHAGWSSLSNMPEVYLHYFGNESSESILEAYGLKPKSTHEADRLRTKQCPNCGESNRVDGRFCTKCKMILSYDAYTEVVEEKTDRIAKLEENQRELLQSLIDAGVLKPKQK